MAKAVAPEAPMRPQYVLFDKPTGILCRPASQAAAELEDAYPASVSVLKVVALSNCVHKAERGPSSYSGGLKHLALGRYAIQQILPGLGERSDPFFEELGCQDVCVNTGLGEFCQFLAWV